MTTPSLSLFEVRRFRSRVQAAAQRAASLVVRAAGAGSKRAPGGDSGCAQGRLHAGPADAFSQSAHNRSVNADVAAWDLIKDVIESSDYYALIIGGRYGSLDEAGIGYTEKEYDYAVSLKKPVIPLLHKSPDNLPRDKTDEGSWKKLLAFRAKVEKRHTCVYWSSADELRAQVIIGLTSAFKRHPAVGWVRASEVPSDATLKETLALRSRLADLEQKLAAAQTSPPEGASELMQGDDQYEIAFNFDAKVPGDTWDEQKQTYAGKIHLTWNEIFAAVAPSMINEAQDYRLKSDLRRFFESRAKEQLAGNAKLKGRNLVNFRFDDYLVDTCVVQFRALGLVRENKKMRSVKDTSTYWTLTPFGDYVMVQLRALRRIPLSTADAAAEVNEGEAGGGAT